MKRQFCKISLWKLTLLPEITLQIFSKQICSINSQLNMNFLVPIKCHQESLLLTDYFLANTLCLFCASFFFFFTSIEMLIPFYTWFYRFLNGLIKKIKIYLKQLQDIVINWHILPEQWGRDPLQCPFNWHVRADCPSSDRLPVQV